MLHGTVTELGVNQACCSAQKHILQVSVTCHLVRPALGPMRRRRRNPFASRPRCCVPCCLRPSTERCLPFFQASSAGSVKGRAVDKSSDQAGVAPWSPRSPECRSLAAIRERRRSRGFAGDVLRVDLFRRHHNLRCCHSSWFHVCRGTHTNSPRKLILAPDRRCLSEVAEAVASDKIASRGGSGQAGPSPETLRPRAKVPSISRNDTGGCARGPGTKMSHFQTLASRNTKVAHTIGTYCVSFSDTKGG